ncbi:hypothetical protein PSPO01_15792 [Paraphaeosphaeria sporulosa]
MPAFAAFKGAHAPRAPNRDSLTVRDPTTQFTSDDASDPFEIDAISLKPRQIVPGLIPTYLRRDGPGSGAVVGIVLAVSPASFF